jgi:hypothetical protein
LALVCCRNQGTVAVKVKKSELAIDAVLARLQREIEKELKAMKG